VAGTGSGSCPMVDYDISGVGRLCSATRELLSYYRKICCSSHCLSWD
jgi:hypothetical protein